MERVPIRIHCIVPVQRVREETGVSILQSRCFLKHKHLCLACLTILVFVNTSYSEYIKYSRPKLYHVRQSACSYNKNITTMDKLELNVSLPESWPDCKVTNVQVRGNDPFLLHNTEGPGQIYRSYFKKRQPKKGETVFVSVDYDVELYQVDIDFEALSKKSYPEYEKNAEYEYYASLTYSPLSEVPEFMQVVNDCKRKAGSNPVLYAKAAFDWIGKNIKYGPQPEGGPKGWFKERQGDCGAIAHIFVALCRSGGIPSRFIAGCWAGGFDGWHCWAEFYVPQVGWIPIDHSPAGGFGHLSNNHLPLVKAGGMKFDVKPGQGGDSAGFVQFGYWFHWVGGGGEGRKIATEFAVESFAYSGMPKAETVRDLPGAYKEALNCLKNKKYDKAIQIYQRLLLLEFMDENDKNQVHYWLAMCYQRKNKCVKAALELLPLIENSNESISKKANSLLKKVRKEEIYVSSLNVERIRQGWGKPRRNKSVEGKQISIGGKSFEKGIGTHSESICLIKTNNSIEEFSAKVGVDDEIDKGKGSVEFCVIGDGKMLWRSGVMKGGEVAKPVKVMVAGVRELLLKVTDGGDGGTCDHADWADAKLIINGIYPTLVKPVKSKK